MRDPGIVFVIAAVQWQPVSFHERMPVIVGPSSEEQWLDPRFRRRAAFSARAVHQR
jgi:putative SOS response-associated peptidase YedK